MKEKRAGQRVKKTVPISLRTPRGEQVGMTENVSQTGICFGTPHHFTIGQEVSVGGATDEPTMRAKIVRFERNPDAESMLWRFRAAAQFLMRTPQWLMEAT